jgi:outer membrane assembly lipoprotein YfiO
MYFVLAFWTIFLFCTTSLQAAPSIRQPRMPEGLSANKTPTTISKLKKPQDQKLANRTQKKKRRGLTHRKKHHTFSNMLYDELKVAKDKSVQGKHFDIAAKYLERMITLCENVNEKAQLIIELANIHFSQKEYDSAKKWYQEFERLYPGNQLIEQAKKNIILCSKQAILSPDRDQAPTEETLRLAKEYLERDLFTLYRKEVAAIQKECESILAQADCGITEFYIKQGNYTSARRRIQHIRTAWLEKVPEVATTLAHLEVQLGAEWKDFKVPEKSTKLAHATGKKEPTQKVDMTTRF